MTPISNLSNLQTLLISFCEINDLSPLSKLTNLKCLDISSNYFKDDDEVTLIIMAIEDGISARDLCSSYEMTTIQYDTARKRFRRGIDRLFPGRRKS